MTNLEKESVYEAAENKVKKLKGFYTHLVVYLVVNTFIIYANYTYSKGPISLFEFRTFSTALFWGIGLLAHGLNVFLIDFLFGKEWEERKINEILNKRNDPNEFV